MFSCHLSLCQVSFLTSFASGRQEEHCFFFFHFETLVLFHRQWLCHVSLFYFSMPALICHRSMDHLLYAVKQVLYMSVASLVTHSTIVSLSGDNHSLAECDLGDHSELCCSALILFSMSIHVLSIPYFADRSLQLGHLRYSSYLQSIVQTPQLLLLGSGRV